MVKISYDSEGKILGAYDSAIQDVPTPFIEVEDSVWGDAHGKFMERSVDVSTLQFICVKDTVKEQEENDAKEREILIDAKKRELAIEALKSEGKLDAEAKLTVTGKASLSVGKSD